MKISEARQIYGGQIKAYNEQKNILFNQKKELELKMKTDPEGKDIYSNEAAILELTIEAVSEKQSEYQEYMEKLIEQEVAIENMVVGKQQGEAMAEYAEDMGKILEVARRIMKGGTVPPNDEKKLMEFSMEMYQAAKNIGAMVKLRKKEEYESLWEDEEPAEEPEDPREVAANSQAPSDEPVVVDVAETIASVQAPSSDT